MKNKNVKSVAKKLTLNDLKKARGGSTARTKTILISNEEGCNGTGKDHP